VTTFAARVPAAFERLHRRRDGGLVAGVCSGLAASARVDPTLVRLVFALLALAGGAGVVAYGAAWLALPDDEAAPVKRWRRVVGIVAILVALSLALRSVGIADTLVWPAVLVAVGAYLLQADRGGDSRRTRRRRVQIGAALTVGGLVLFGTTVAHGAHQGSLVAPAGLLVGIVLVVGPWIWRLAQERDAERLARIRAQERADVAARVHDSVLQTLALIQRSDDPKRVAALARRQERELRGWLYGQGDTEGETLRHQLEDTLADIEELHGVRVEIVQTGDLQLDERLSALVLATREAVTNAAVHAGVEEVSVFVQVTADEVAVYVRDRGSGFDRAAVPGDRRGIAESIEGRLARSGGSASVRSEPGDGTEIELRLPLESPQ
jgi:signal transduction histidine kinase